MTSSSTERRNSGISLPLKATPAPASIILNSVSSSQLSSALPSSNQSSESSSCDFIVTALNPCSDINQSKLTDNEQIKKSEQKLQVPQSPPSSSNHHHHHFNALARVLNKARDLSPPGSPSPRKIASPMSSIDSLASLIERQENNKISNPSHQLFNKSPYRHSKKSSGSSVFSILNSGSIHRRTSSNTTAPAVKSPLNNQLESNAASRRLTPSQSNPTHIHSSPSVKESKKVYLEYDPVSKRKVLNTYEIVKEIGRGEHGKVKLAKEITSGEFVAIKILDRKGKQKLGKILKPGSTEEEKIRREIAIMKKINHPNVVQLKEVLDDTDSRKIYLVLEFLEKGEVKWQKSPGVPILTLPEAMKDFRDVVLGLEYLHYQGIIHRDIKPANLLIAKNGAVKISDFGVSFASSLKNGEEQNDYDLAKTAGTPAFFAPEICQPLTNFEFDDTNGDVEITYPKITSKIDIWALGITLYCLLFGSMPFWATNEFELFKVICDKQLEFPSVFPENFEWSEEDKFEAKNLLLKMLEKDSTKRISIKEIKRHPFVLRNLSVQESRVFSTVQKACENKIQVSNAEVSVAVTGIASKLRKGFAKALKFAAGLGSELNSSTSLSSNRHHHGKEKTHSRTASSDSKHLVFESDDLENSNATLIDQTKALGASSDIKRNLSPIRSTRSTSGNSRVRSIDSASETKATVEGDLFLKKGSAFNSLSHIINDDRRRSSVSSGTFNSSGFSEGYDSSLSGGSVSQVVSLPVNASFASLDSVYLDNYATAYYTEVKDARNPRKSNMDPPNIPFPSSFTDDESKSKNKTNDNDLFKKMSDFSLENVSSQPTNYDMDVAPHEPTVAKFDLNDDDSETDSDDSEMSASISANAYYGDGLDDHDFDDRIVFGRQESSDQMSQFSVPSMLANDLARNVTNNSKTDSSSESTSQNPPHLSSRPKIPITGPKYSFFETSDSEESEDEISNSPDSDIQDVNMEHFEFYHSDEEGDESEEDSGSSTDESSEGEELMLTFGRRNRTNTIPTSTIPDLVGRPQSVPEFNQNSQPSVPPRSYTTDKVSVSRPINPKPERLTSPLSKNAPHTPFSTINAHLIPKTDFHPQEYVNHYNKVQPPVSYHLENNIGISNEENGSRGRSNSITMGILGHQASQ